MALKFVERALGLSEIKQRITDLEYRVDSLEGEVSRVLKHFGNFKNRSSGELRLMKDQVEDLLASVDALIGHAEHKESIARAKRLRKRLKNHRTRIENARAA